MQSSRTCTLSQMARMTHRTGVFLFDEIHKCDPTLRTALQDFLEPEAKQVMDSGTARVCDVFVVINPPGCRHKMNTGMAPPGRATTQPSQSR